MATLAVKSEMDAAQALLDLHGDQREHDSFNRRNVSVDSVDGSTAIARILSSLISSKPAQLAHTSTPKTQVFISKRLTDTSERRNTKYNQSKNKIMCDKATQTEFEVYLPEIEKMDTIIKDLCTKIETLEKKLKRKKSDTSHESDSYEQHSDTSSDEYSVRQYRRRSYKRRRNLTTTTDFSSTADCDSTYTKDRDETPSNAKVPKEVKRALKPKNTNTSNEMVLIGDGNASVPVRLLKHMDWSSYTNATRKLLTAVFSRKVLATHSLTGKPSPAFPDKPAKKKLDPVLVNDIVQTVVEKCCVPENVVRTSITTKCADESKMFRTRELNKKKRRSVKKENISPDDDSDDSYTSC